MPERTGPSSAFECYQKICDPGLAKKPWVVGDKATVTFGQLRTRIELVGALLAGTGLSTGERVVIATQDDLEAAQLFVALVCNGVTVVNLDPDMGPERARSLVAKADPRLVLIDRHLVSKWALPASAATRVEIVAAVGTAAGLGALIPRTRRREGLHALLDAQTPARPVQAIDPETLAYIMFTSGTTDLPKGVSISHRALFAHLQTLSRRFGYDSSSRILNTLMLTHADGMIQGPVLAFCNAIPVFRPLRFEISTIDRLLDAVYQLRITHFVAVPTMLALIQRLGLDHRDAFHGGDFRLLISCGAQLEAALWSGFESIFRVPIVNVYGLTETVVGGVFSGPDARSRMPGSIGMPVDCELRIVDKDGTDVADGHTGELWIRGELLMSGYFEAPQLTAEVMLGDWFRTGDAARRDESGRYWINGRYKNIIIRGGYNIHPEEITEVLNRHAGVREAVTIGMPDTIWGEVVVSVVSADAEVSNEELMAHCARSLEPRKIPTRIERVESLPRGLSGKVRLAAIRELLRAPPDAPGAASDPAEKQDRLLRVAARCFKASAADLTLASTPKDVPGWDSLAHLEFVSALEQEFDMQLSPRQIMALNRLDRALELIPSP